MFKHLVDAISWIEHQPKFREKTDLSYIKTVINHLNLELSEIKKIHVAGTNGKGSTSAYLSYMAIENNLKVGTFTSPYLIKFNERIRINMLPIDDKRLLESINHIYEYCKDENITLSFFELTTIMALIIFKEEKLDLIVMEVGLGGLLDATNALTYDVSLITNIGFDHMKQLGSTLESIASNKLGIVKENGTLITTVKPELYPQFMKYCEYKHAQLILISPEQIHIDGHNFSFENETYELPLKGDYQAFNAALAIKGFKYMFNELPTDVIKRGILKTKWAGRLEEVRPKIYLDGAHNTHAISALISTLKTTFNNKNIHVIFSALADKEPESMVKLLKPYVSSLTLTSFEDIRFKDLSQIAESQGLVYEPTFIKLYRHLKNTLKDDDIILITGSLHFIGYVATIINQGE